MVAIAEMGIRRFFPGEGFALLDGDRWTYTVGSEYEGFPKSKLLNNNLADAWMARHNKQSHGWISGVSYVAERSRLIRYVGGLRTNRHDKPEIPVGELGITENLVRVRIDKNYPLVNRLRPDVVGLSKTNLNGSISDITNFPVDPPAVTAPGYKETRLLVVNPAVNTSCTITFDDKFALERHLTGRQIIKVSVRQSLNTTLWPAIVTTLRQTGTDISTLSQYNEESAVIGLGVEAEKTTEGYLFTYSFDASLLPSPTGQVGIRVDGTTTGVSAPEVIKIDWFADIEMDDPFDPGFDSNWLDLNDRTNDIVLANQDVPKASSVYVDVQWSTYCSVRVGVIGGHTVKYLTVLSDSGLRVGKIIAMETLEVPLLSSDGYVPRKAGNTGSYTRTYQSDIRSPRNAATWWEADITVAALKQSRIFGELEDQFNAMGLYSLPTLFIPDPTDLNTALWACLSSWEAPHRGTFSGIDDDNVPYSNEEMYELEFSIVEKTGRRTTR